MKKIVSLIVALVLVLSLSCAVAEKPYAGQTLTVSNFAFNGELLQKNIYDPFMEMTGCEIVVDAAGNAQRVTKITEAPEDYDVVVIGDMFVKQLMDAGCIDTVDAAKLTNLEGIYESARAPMGAEYGPAYTFNRLGIVYDSAYCDVEIKSFADLWNPELEDSIAIPDMTATTGPMFYFATAETFGLVLSRKRILTAGKYKTISIAAKHWALPHFYLCRVLYELIWRIFAYYDGEVSKNGLFKFWGYMAQGSDKYA